jgi:hypothetical protein
METDYGPVLVWTCFSCSGAKSEAPLQVPQPPPTWNSRPGANICCTPGSPVPCRLDGSEFGVNECFGLIVLSLDLCYLQQLLCLFEFGQVRFALRNRCKYRVVRTQVECCNCQDCCAITINPVFFTFIQL